MQCEAAPQRQRSMEHQQMDIDMADDQSQLPLEEKYKTTDNQSQDAAMGEDHGNQETAVSEELRCRYSNKRCTNPRTKKRTGGLHAFCEEHRENANRNQRKLDSKKRVERRQHQSILSYYETIQAAHELDPSLVVTPPALAPTVAVEPYPRPIGLLEEDVDVLVSLFGEPDNAEAALDHTNAVFRPQ